MNIRSEVKEAGMSENEYGLSEHRKTFLSVLIALTAATGALVSWQASRAGNAADSADGQAIAAALNEAGNEMSIASDVFLSETNARELLTHLESARDIHREVMRNPAVPGRWLDDWQSEIIRARVRHLQLNTDFLISKDGRQVFDGERYRQAVRAQAASEKPIDTAPFRALSEAKRRAAVFLISLNLLFASALFLFTAALRTGRGGRPVWTAAGLALYVCASGLAVWKIFF